MKKQISENHKSISATKTAMSPEVELEYNYYKLLEDIKECYDKEVNHLEVPFSCAKDYPKDLCYRLQKLQLNVDITKQSILIQLPIKKA
jgi:hypothetical protein